jgi:WD40 repeat protein
MRILKGCDSVIRCLTYSPNGQLLAVGDEASYVRLWALPAGEEAVIFDRGDIGSIECLAFSPSGKWLAVGVPKGIVVWDPFSHEIIDTRHGHTGGIRGLFWQPHGKLLASCGWDREVCFWTESLARRWEPVTVPEPMMALAFTPDGSRLMLAGNNGTLMLIDMPQRKAGDELKHDRGLFSLACAPDGRLVAAGDTRGDVILWDTSGETAPHTLRGHEWTVYGLAFTPDGKSLVSGSADGTVRLWETDTGRLVDTFRWHSRWVTSVAVSPDGMTAASGSADGTVVVWDLADV